LRFDGDEEFQRDSMELFRGMGCRSRISERLELALVDLPVDAGILDRYPSYEAYETSMYKSSNGDPKA
jgi:hypothetical protein